MFLFIAKYQILRNKEPHRRPLAADENENLTEILATILIVMANN